MFILSRYVLRLFVKVFVICFLSLAGLTIVIDAFTNLDEFMAIGEQHGGLLNVLGPYYGARLVSFFDRISPLLTLVSAMFAVTWLQRTNEMTALQAAGISKGRIIRPLLAAAVAVCLIAALNRELVLPRIRGLLAQDARNWSGDKPHDVHPQYDQFTDIFLGGKSAIVKGQKIEEPRFRLPPSLSQFGRQLAAKEALYRPAAADRPAGYLLRGMESPKDIGERHSLYWDNQPIILTPHDTKWLKPGECFVVSQVGFEQLAGGDAFRRFSSTRELVHGLRNPSMDYGADVRVAVHARFLTPLLDMTLLLLGLPLILSNESRNLFVAAGLCLILVAAFFITVMTCHALGSRMWLNPALAAWLPLMAFGPLAYSLSGSIRE